MMVSWPSTNITKATADMAMRQSLPLLPPLLTRLLGLRREALLLLLFLRLLVVMSGDHSSVPSVLK